MKPKILIIGSTGELGTKLCNYCFKNDIEIDAICCYKNSKKLIFLKKRNNIKYSYELGDKKQKKDFLFLLHKKKFDLIYFLDYGSASLEYAKILLNNNGLLYNTAKLIDVLDCAITNLQFLTNSIVLYLNIFRFSNGLSE